jgi:asparagine synthase (glutamine-hydrolysing)
LSGDGGDELFGGYERYRVGDLWGAMSRLPLSVRRVLAKGIAQSGHPRASRLSKIVAASDVADLNDLVSMTWRPGPVLVSQSPVPQANWETNAKFSPVDSMMLLDTLGYLPDDILVKVDRAAMSTALETRVPFLDPDIFDFAWSLPDRFRRTNGTGKVVVRHLLGRYVPAAMWDRPKQGFGVPIGTWLRGDLKNWAEELIEPGRLRREGFLDSATVGATWSEHQDGSANRQHQLWSVLMFQSWLERTRLNAELSVS